MIVNGNAVEMPWVKEIPSIVQSWYLGSVGGEALADVLSGEVTPSGKLPFSYPVKLKDCPAHFLEKSVIRAIASVRNIKKIFWLAIAGMI